MINFVRRFSWQRAVAVPLALVVLTVSSPANAQSPSHCEQPYAIFAGVGEHGERVFSDTPAGENPYQLAAICIDAPGADEAKSTATDILELALLLAADRRAESEQRREQERVRNERRASALDPVPDNGDRHAGVRERTWVSAYPYGLNGRHRTHASQSHSQPQFQHPPPAAGDPAVPLEAPQPGRLSKRFPVR